MTAPFTGQGEAAVCARVWVAWVRYWYNKQGRRLLTPALIIGDARGAWPVPMPLVMRMCVSSMSAYCGSADHRSRRWLTEVIRRDALGLNFRSCLYFTYKTTRRDDPRVTNRGVIDRATTAMEDRELGFSTSGREVSDD